MSVPRTAILQVAWHTTGDGKLIVPTTGLYYIYEQLYFRSTEGRIHVQVKNKLVILMEPS